MTMQQRVLPVHTWAIIRPTRAHAYTLWHTLPCFGLHILVGSTLKIDPDATFHWLVINSTFSTYRPYANIIGDTDTRNM